MRPFLLALITVCLVTACDTILFGGDRASTDPRTNFEYLWKEVDQKYSYFELKNIDWDSVYSAYSPGITSGMSQDSLFKLLGGMLKVLRDDHTNLISDFNISFFGIRNRNPDNYDPRIVIDNYLPKDYYISGPFQHDYILGTGNRVGYVRLPSFTGTVDGANFSFVLKRYEDTEGLIIDLRENGGGAVSDVFDILSRFVDERTLVFYSRIKNGPGSDDFSDPEEVYIEPYDGPRYTDSPVIFLVDRGTFSAGSLTALATKAIPNITLAGDTTGGGLGLPNGGQLPNGWRYRFSVSQTLDLSLDNRFENGVPPDIQVSLDRTDISTDEIIERAIFEILN